MELLTKKDIKLLKKALKCPNPCFGCDEQKYYIAACTNCDKDQRWDDKFKQPLQDRGLYQLYGLLIRLSKNKKNYENLIADIINESGANNICWIRDILDMI